MGVYFLLSQIKKPFLFGRPPPRRLYNGIFFANVNLRNLFGLFHKNDELMSYVLFTPKGKKKYDLRIKVLNYLIANYHIVKPLLKLLFEDNICALVVIQLYPEELTERVQHFRIFQCSV